MKTHSFINYILFLCIGVLFISCNEYLDTPPSKRNGVEITTVEHLDAVFNNISKFYSELCQHPYGTDDYGYPPELYLLAPRQCPILAVEYGLWNITDLPTLTNTVWSAEYTKIFSANMVLDFIDKVSGDKAQKENLRAEAHFIRAYSMWTLANMHCLPYTENNKKEMGLTAKTTTSFEQSLKRTTLEETYRIIEEDIQEALKINLSITSATPHRTWRISKEAVEAFAARFYLHKGNYNLALRYANAALSGYGELVDYNSEITYKIESKTIDGKKIQIKMPSTSAIMRPQEAALEWKEFYYFRVLFTNYWMVPTESLMNTYDQDHDLRFRYHFVQNYSIKYVNTAPLDNLYPGYVFFNQMLGLPFGLTTSETILIKAECQARGADQWQQAMTTLDLLRQKRMDASAPGFVHLTATSQAEAIRNVLAERRRELPFTQRWYDLRRLNNNEDTNDDIEVISKKFFPYNPLIILKDEPIINYELKKNSRRYAIPLPFSDIDASQDQLQQNIY